MSVYAVNETDVWIAAHAAMWGHYPMGPFFFGSILHWNGATWNRIKVPNLSTLYSVSMVDYEDGWTVGEAGFLCHWNGTEWARQPSE